MKKRENNKCFNDIIVLISQYKLPEVVFYLRVYIFE